MLRNKTGHIALALLSAGILCITAACAPKPHLSSDFDLNEYQWAVFMSTTGTDKLFPSALSGHVAFVKSDGSYELLGHRGMDYGSISWTTKGIYFVDSKGDMWVDAHGLTVHDFERVSDMDGLVTLNDQETRVSVFNGGFTKDAYKESVIVAHPGSHEQQTLTTEGFFPLISACENDVFGGYSSWHKPDGSAYFILDQIVDNAAIKHSRILTEDIPYSEFSYFAKDAPCIDNHIVFLATYFNYSDSNFPGDAELNPYLQHEINSGDYVATVVSIDVTNGHVESHPLIDAEGNPVNLSHNELGLAQIDAGSISDGRELMWIGGNGVLYQTDIETGQTDVMNQSLSQDDNHGIDVKWLYHYSSTPTTISVLVEGDNPLAQLRIVTFDRASGDIKQDLTVTGLDQDVSQSMIIRDIAAKP